LSDWIGRSSTAIRSFGLPSSGPRSVAQR